MRKPLRSNFKQSRRAPIHQKKTFFTKENLFVSRIASILLIPKTNVMNVFSQRAITTIRLNPLKGDVNETKELLEKKEYELQPISWDSNTYFVLNHDKSEVSQTPEYQDGRFYIQNLSSILDTLVLDPKEGENILDMCAAPGSKTTHIAAVTNNKSKIIANDSDMSRVSALKNVLFQFGAKNAKATISDATDFGRKYPDYFDRVLLDAPCSGEGMIYMGSMKPLRFWSLDKIKRCSFLQKDLVLSAFRTLKKGGYLVYSTCTLEPEENEGVITFLLEHFPNAQVEEIVINVEKEYRMNGITKWSGHTYDPAVKKTLRIIPNSKMMGFYIAKIKKN
jgi:16S rRNA (cytosine1407-C5)-methyltransferase